ncbi:MAG: DUF2764 domain-containing protein [Prolixibacteraceae bacterium]|nr:DUF2764 domain-containing protein [Prolixibacteraceae bacterium]
MANYYYLISGLPEIQLDDQKLKLSLSGFKTEINENLTQGDLKMIGYYFMQFDNKNLLKLLADKEAEIDPLGNLTREELLDNIQQFRETDNPADKNIYPYFRQFVPDYLIETPIMPNLSWEDQLTALFYNYAINSKNQFISDWYEFNLNISNVIIGTNCRKFDYDREKSIIGNNEVANAIRKSNAKDFGVKPILPEIDDILRILEEPNLLERERKIDFLKWNWLEEKGFFHYFDMEHLFIYLIRLDLLERWVQLERETGEKVFREMISELQHAFEFPNEFTVKKVQ